ncbi:MAG: zinc-dependent metalloprotease [Acidimicrobiales bacterium]
MADAPETGGERRPGADGLVDWSTAERVAGWLVRREAPPPSYRPAAMQAELDELTARAESLVAAATGLHPPTPARARVIDRAGWVHANVVSFQRLLGPSLEKLEARRSERSGALPLALRLPPPLAGVGRTVSGVQLGLVLSWMSTRVLGQYDLLLSDERAEEQDLVYYVGPNVVAMEERHGFPPQPFRLWLALHEVTHRCQFTAVPWLRDHFVSLVDQGLEPFLSDPRHLLEAIRRAADEVRSGRSPFDDAGMLGLVAGPEQLDALRRVQALMSLLEGHGDVTMDRAGAAEVPGAERFSRVLRERRQQVRGPAKLLQKVLGLDAKMRQYAEGEGFVNAVERMGGRDLLDRVWRGPEWLPSLPEIRDPDRWVSRVTAAGAG